MSPCGGALLSGKRARSTSSGITVSHTYTEPGSYAVVLAVTDDDGATDTATDTVTAELCDACSLSGRITADSNITVDGDLNDLSAPYTSNDDSSTAQMLPNPVMLNGFVSTEGTLNVGSVSLTTGTAAYGQIADFVPGQAIIKKAFKSIQQNQVQPLNRLGAF